MTSSRGKPACGLVADDDPLIRMVMRVALESRGMSVVEASTGAEAIAVAESVDFGVVDARMPGLSLAETIAGLRESRWLPLLVVSGAQPDVDLLPDIEHLTKPIELDEFLGAVDRLLVTSAPGDAGRISS